MGSFMRESLTESFRSALAGAQHAARELNQDFVGTEHLMLGLLETDGQAVRTLAAAHAEAPRLRSALLAILPRGSEPPIVTGNLPLSPKAQRIINGAIVTAQALRESHVSSRFLLLSLMDEPHSAIRKALHEIGVDVEALQHKLAEKPESGEA